MSNARQRCLMWILGVWILTASSGCSLGPSLIRGSRTKYNHAVQTTAREEMLLNIVRAKYSDPPEFLAISGITTQAEVGTGLSFGNEHGLGDAKFAGSLTAANRPTVSLAPLQDEQFTRRYLSPIRLDTIYLFCRNGRNVERVLRLVVDKANGLRNSPDESGIDCMPGAFRWITQTLDTLARQELAEIAYEERDEPVSPAVNVESLHGTDVVAALEKGYRFRAADNDQVVLTEKSRDLVLRFSPDAVGQPEVEEITGLLSLRPGQSHYPIKPAMEGQLRPTSVVRDEILVSTRSVEEILHFLSHGVEAPLKHFEQGIVSTPNMAPGGCATGTSDLLRIRSSKTPPCHASAAIYYRGYWFYIEDSDPASRETFEILLELYYLEIRGGGAVGMPLLTLPVGR